MSVEVPELTDEQIERVARAVLRCLVQRGKYAPRAPREQRIREIRAELERI